MLYDELTIASCLDTLVKKVERKHRVDIGLEAYRISGAYGGHETVEVGND